MGVRVPFLLVPVTSVAPWSTFLTLRRGEAGKDLRLQATLLQGDAVAAQAFFEAAGRMLIIRHRVPFHELGKHAPKAVLSLVPLTHDQTLRDEYDDYFTKKERMGVAACLGDALYVVPPVRAQECGIGNVMVPTKSLVGAIATAPHHSKSDGMRQAPSGKDEAHVGAEKKESKRPAEEGTGKQAKDQTEAEAAEVQGLAAEAAEEEATEEADEVEIVDIEGKSDEIEIIDVEDPPPETPEPNERAAKPAMEETPVEASSKECPTPDTSSKPAVIEAPRVAQFSREDVAKAAEAVTRKEPREESSRFLEDSCKYLAPAFLPRELVPAMPGYRWHEAPTLPPLPSWDPWMLSDQAAHAAGVPQGCDRKRRKHRKSKKASESQSRSRDRKKKTKKAKKARRSTTEAPTRAEITARFDALAQDLDFESESGSQSDGKLSESE